MDVKILLRYFSCGLILYCLDAKSISLNELIAAEKINLHSHQEISSVPEHLPPSKVLPLFEIPTHTKSKKRGEASKTNQSLLKFRKTFLNKTQPKPKILKYLQKPDHKRKNLTTKREVQKKHVKINQKYIPLFRNIELLFDNILSSDSNETYEPRRDKYNIYKANKKDTCRCSGKYDSEDSYSQDERATSTSSPSDEVEEAFVITTSPQTDNLVHDNISRFRRNKNIPLLFARNTTSFRRNGAGFSERSGPTHNRRSEGHIPGDNGSSKRNAIIGEDASDSENNDQNSKSDSRNDASPRFTGGIRGIGNTQIAQDNGGASTTTILLQNETPQDDTGIISEHEEQIEFQVGGNEAKGPVFLSETSERNSEAQDIPIRSTEGYEKSIPSDISGDKRFFVRNGQIASENKKNRKPNEAVGPKVVMIFDGYSVARDVNGENKMTEKAIHIHS